ncbi:MAG TPA: tripartite tricarboxylate transporter substrate-binding protein [Acetobacteraceae bacterium]|nr:tripartite tricarboxylate transporter substrate-binding protein [Acetobacteraceae bacterium]
MIVPELPTDPGGIALRVLAPELEAALGRPVVVDFRPGAGGIVGLMAGASAAPDGLTLTVLTPAVTLAPWLSRRMDCTPADFAPLGRISFAPSLLLVGAASPWRSLDDLLGAARAGRRVVVPAPWDWRPAEVAQAMFLARTGLPHVTALGAETGGERLAQLARGEVDLAFAAAEPTRLGALAGVRVLAVAGPARLPGLDAPTLAEAGVDLTLGPWRMLAVPSQVPERLRAPLQAALRGALAETPLRAALARAGIAPSWIGPAGAADQLAEECRQAGALFSALGLNVRAGAGAAMRS